MAAVGFEWRYNISGGNPIIRDVVVYTGITLTVGCLCNVETGELTLAVTNDAALIGACVETVDNTSDGESCKVIMNPDAVYAVVDANARVIGATLDIATGALTVGTSSNIDLIVVETSSATEETLVMIAPGEHFLD